MALRARYQTINLYLYNDIGCCRSERSYKTKPVYLLSDRYSSMPTCACFRGHSKHWTFHAQTGNTHIKAFDTIKLSNILGVLEQARCDKDKLRFVRLLLAEARLKVRIKTGELFYRTEDLNVLPTGRQSLLSILFTLLSRSENILQSHFSQH